MEYLERIPVYNGGIDNLLRYQFLTQAIPNSQTLKLLG